MEQNKYPHINYSFREEGIEYNDGRYNLEVWSTWINGTRIYLDDLKSNNDEELTVEFKKKWFQEVVDFVNITRKEKPILEFTIDSTDGKLWDELCKEFEKDI